MVTAPLPERVNKEELWMIPQSVNLEIDYVRVLGQEYQGEQAVHLTFPPIPTSHSIGTEPCISRHRMHLLCVVRPTMTPLPKKEIGTQLTHLQPSHVTPVHSSSP